MADDGELLTTTAVRVVDHCLARPPTLGASRLICVDGGAGAGKTTLGAAVLTAATVVAPSSHLLHMDDLYEGWHGLPSVAARVRGQIVEPLAAGRAGRYHRWDWAADRWAEEHTVAPVALLVLEGVGSGALEYADRITTLVWVEAPPATRLERGLARDGADQRELWEGWMASEAAHLGVQNTRARADLIVDGLSGELTARG